MATFELYRRSTIGTCLTEALDEMVDSDSLPPLTAIRVLIQFDKSITEALKKRVKTKISLKGHLDTYRFCDDVWTFILQDALLKTKDKEEEEHIGDIKIVAIDSALLG